MKISALVPINCGIAVKCTRGFISGCIEDVSRYPETTTRGINPRGESRGRRRYSIHWKQQRGSLGSEEVYYFRFECKSLEMRTTVSPKINRSGCFESPDLFQISRARERESSSILFPEQIAGNLSNNVVVLRSISTRGIVASVYRIAKFPNDYNIGEVTNKWLKM